jgi:hypothetical protein
LGFIFISSQVVRTKRQEKRRKTKNKMEREKGKALDQQALITLPARPHLGIFSSIVESDAGGLKHNNA